MQENLHRVGIGVTAPALREKGRLFEKLCPSIYG